MKKKELDSLMATWKWDDQDSTLSKASASSLFHFNPNLVSQEELIKLGFSSFLAGRVINYRNKGGKFIVKKDLAKIYGMDSLLYRKIFLYIDLPDEPNFQSTSPKRQATEKKVVAQFDLNQADTTQLIAVYGIGSKLAHRIIAYREKLGGFIAADQLKEVYGLDSAVVHELIRKSFIDENFKPRLVDINHATEQELSNHPYIKYKLAKAITAYRFQHGRYDSVEDLKKITLINEPAFQKIKPYLSANP